MTNSHENAELSALIKQLEVIDTVNTPQALELADNQAGELYVEFSMKILKLAKIGTFINANCTDRAITSAFKLYSAIAVDAIQWLLGKIPAGE